MAEEIVGKSVQEIQVELALTRTVLALDRTLLAWVRSSLSLFAFGFTLARFVHDLIVGGSLHGIDRHYPREIGVILMLLAMAALMGGAFDHWRSVRRLKKEVAISPWSSSLVLALVLVVISAFLMFNLLKDLGPPYP